jgi:hypothetical protein
MKLVVSFTGGERNTYPTTLTIEPLPAKDQMYSCFSQHAEIVKSSGKRPNGMNWKTTDDHYEPMEQCIALSGNSIHSKKSVNIAFTNNEGQCIESVDVCIERENVSYSCEECDFDGETETGGVHGFIMSHIKPHFAVLTKESRRLRIADLTRDKLDPATQEPLSVDNTEELKCGHFISMGTFAKLTCPKKCPFCRAPLCDKDSDCD